MRGAPTLDSTAGVAVLIHNLGALSRRPAEAPRLHPLERDILPTDFLRSTTRRTREAHRMPPSPRLTGPPKARCRRHCPQRLPHQSRGCTGVGTPADGRHNAPNKE